VSQRVTSDQRAEVETVVRNRSQYADTLHRLDPGADGLSPVQWESMETLVTDGGEAAPADIADSHGRHVESVRRALREMEDPVEREYGSVSLRSEYVAEMVHAAVDEARESIERATEATAKAMEAAERGLDETMNAFIAWPPATASTSTTPARRA